MSAPAALLLASAPSAPPTSVQSLEARIAAVIAPEMKTCPGMAVAISKEGTVVYRSGFGTADLAGKIPATPATRFKIGSLSKAFTAALIQKLAAEGKLGLDDPIAKYFPGAPDAWKTIAVRDLLNHTSGLVSYTEMGGIMLRIAHPTAPAGQEQAMILGAVTRTPTTFPAGTKFEYSNTNYNLLGLIAEKVGGAPLEAQLKTRIFDPLGMAATTLERKGRTTPGEAEGSTLVRGKLAPAPPIDMSWPYAAGSVVSSADDMLRWIDGLEGKVLTPEMQKAAFAPRPLKDGSLSFYGFGWGLSTRGNEPMFRHAGSINGFASFALRLPTSKVSLVLLTNSSDGSRVMPLALRVLDAYEGKEAPTGIEDKDPKLTARLREVVDGLLKGERDPAQFDPAFLKAVPETQWRATGEGIGALGEVAEFRLIGTAGPRRDYTLLVGPARLTVSFTLGADGKIVGMLLK